MSLAEPTRMLFFGEREFSKSVDEPFKGSEGVTYYYHKYQLKVAESGNHIYEYQGIY